MYFTQSINQSFNQSFIHPFNQSINQEINLFNEFNYIIDIIMYYNIEQITEQNKICNKILYVI